MSPSSSASPSAFTVVSDIDIVAIQQVDNLTVIKTAAFDLIIHKQLDEVTILDIENALSGSASLADDIVATKQLDNIVITKSPNINLTII